MLFHQETAAVFVSASQNARVLTGGWIEASLFRPNCGEQPISRFAANRPIADFLCDRCSEEYELKSQTARLGARVVDGRLRRYDRQAAGRNNRNLSVRRFNCRAGRATGLRRVKATCCAGAAAPLP